MLISLYTLARMGDSEDVWMMNPISSWVVGRGRSEIHPWDRNHFPKIDQWVPAPHTSGTLGSRHVYAQRSNASYVTDWFYVKERRYNSVDVWCRRGKWLENNESKAPAIHCRALCPIRAIFYRFAAPCFHDLKPASLKTTDAETWNPGLHFLKNACSRDLLWILFFSLILCNAEQRERYR